MAIFKFKHNIIEVNDIDLYDIVMCTYAWYSTWCCLLCMKSQLNIDAARVTSSVPKIYTKIDKVSYHYISIRLDKHEHKYQINRCQIILMYFEYSTDPPIVSMHPTNITVNETEEVVMICNYKANPATLTSVKWQVWMYIRSIYMWLLSHFPLCYLASKTKI